MKRCFKCGIEKELSEFYAHPRMGDGHLNKCKQCTKNDVHNNYRKNIQNPEWHQKEKDRGVEKYHRLGYSESQKQTPEEKKKVMQNYKQRYPEKQIAKILSGSVEVPLGLEKHHWSYRKENARDVIFLSVRDHKTAHRYMIYDQEQKMYRTRSGLLLDSREKHEQYIEIYITLNRKPIKQTA
jgi:hypothetical protein